MTPPRSFSAYILPFFAVADVSRVRNLPKHDLTPSADGKGLLDSEDAGYLTTIRMALRYICTTKGVR